LCSDSAAFFIAARYAASMATKPDYYIETTDTGARSHPWRWDLRRRSQPMGVRLGAGGYQSQASAQIAGELALARFLEEVAREERRK
jgi:hypothetical protein